MSGKSTYIRSLCALALLANCGLMVPAKSAAVSELLNLLVVSPAGDRPSDGLSAFAVETQAIAVSLRDSLNTHEGKCSLVLVDEFGRGTSPLDGVSLTAALLELFVSKSDKISCVFATHLHDTFKLEMIGGHLLSWQQMVDHRVEAGQCFNSLGIETASIFGLPAEVTRRACEIRDTLLTTAVNTTREKPEDLESTLSRMLGAGTVTLQPGQTLPPKLQAGAVVYVLRFADGGVYIGETENFEKRLIQHKTRFGKEPIFSQVSPQVSKSAARSMETALIQAVNKLVGVKLLSHTDGNRRCSSSN